MATHQLRTTPAFGPGPVTDEEGPLDVFRRILRRRWLTIVQAIVITGLLAGLYSSTRDERYTTGATLLFGSATDSVLGNTGYVDKTREAATNENLLGLGVVAQEAARVLDDGTPAGTVAAAVDVASDPNSDLVDVQATATDPARAAAMANAYAEAFIDFRRRSTTSQLEAALTAARERQAELSTRERANQAGQDLQAQIDQLELAIARETGGAELVQRAAPPSAPTSPKPVRDGILGAMLGAIFGFGLAALRERSDRRLRTVEELEEATRWPVLTQIPQSRALRSVEPLPPNGAEIEAFRILRTGLRYVAVQRPIESVMISSAQPGDGKSTTAWRLAETMAAMGDSVVLVEADMRRTTATDPDLEPSGLSGALAGLPLSEVLETAPVSQLEPDRYLTVLPAGPLAPNSAALLESERMREIMVELGERFDVVIVDAPPLNLLSDALTLVQYVTGILVVAALGRTTRDDLRQFEDRIGLLGGNVLGTVVNFAPDVEPHGYYLPAKT